MSKNNEMFDLGKSTEKKRSPENHAPSSIQADTLFTFMTQLDYLLQAINTSMLSPRYCEEDIRYLKIKNLKRIAFPMKCFCDINLHKLNDHLDWYGFYGLAFSKEWGMKNKIQPIQYINPESNLKLDFSTAFSAALQSKEKKQSATYNKLANFLFHEMMYYKPYQGKMKNRNNSQIKTKCFTDECEWRFIPDVTIEGFEMAYYNEDILNTGLLNDLNRAMAGIKSISLPFDYKDIKYIIIKDNSDFEILFDEISKLTIDETVKYALISKVIIWDNSKGDF